MPLQNTKRTGEPRDEGTSLVCSLQSEKHIGKCAATSAALGAARVGQGGAAVAHSALQS